MTNGTAPAEKKAAKKKAPVVKLFVKGKELGEKDKLPPQAKVIVGLIRDMSPVKRDDLVKAMKGKIKTRQPEERILSYYQSRLVNEGYIKIQREEAKAA